MSNPNKHTASPQENPHKTAARRRAITRVGGSVAAVLALTAGAYKLGQHNAPENGTTQTNSTEVERPKSEEALKLLSLVPEEATKAMKEQAYSFDHFEVTWDGSIAAAFASDLDSARSNQYLQLDYQISDADQKESLRRMKMEYTHGVTYPAGGLKIDPNADDGSARVTAWFVTDDAGYHEYGTLTTALEARDIVNGMVDEADRRAGESQIQTPTTTD